MVESYLIKILKPEILRFKDNKVKDNEIILNKYVKKLNKKCIDILYNKIDYFYTERIIGLNNYKQQLSYVLSKNNLIS